MITSSQLTFEMSIVGIIISVPLLVLIGMGIKRFQISLMKARIQIELSAYYVLEMKKTVAAIDSARDAVTGVMSDPGLLSLYPADVQENVRAAYEADRYLDIVRQLDRIDKNRKRDER